IDRACVREASRQPRPSSAPGVDQVTAPQYAEHLDDTRRDLPERRRAQRYAAPPVARVGIEQDDGTQRPRGTPGCEDTRGQRAVGMRLAAIVEPEVHGCSPGCRKGPRHHPARPELREKGRTVPMAWIVEAAGSGCCDTLAWG